MPRVGIVDGALGLFFALARRSMICFGFFSGKSLFGGFSLGGIGDFLVYVLGSGFAWSLVVVLLAQISWLWRRHKRLQ